jgi:hypothetical protein
MAWSDFRCSRAFAPVFGNAIREFALNIGKEACVTFGEVYDHPDGAGQELMAMRGGMALRKVRYGTW